MQKKKGFLEKTMFNLDKKKLFYQAKTMRIAPYGHQMVTKNIF